MYYPKVKVDACLSSPAHDAPSDFAMDQMTSYLKHADHHNDSQMNRLNTLINQIDWADPSQRAKFRNKARLSGFDNQCFYRGKKVRIVLLQNSLTKYKLMIWPNQLKGQRNYFTPCSMLAKVRKGNYWTLFEKRNYISSNFSMFKINIYNHCVETEYGKVHVHVNYFNPRLTR